MLTKNLLKGRILDGKLKPTFITKKNALGMDATSQIVELAGKMNGVSFTKFKSALSEAGLSLNPYAQGLVKILKDKFITHEDIDFEAIRWDLIKASESERAHASSYEEFLANMEERFHEEFSGLQSKIYGDLDEEVPMMISKDLTSSLLVERYNMATAKGFLIKAEEIEVKVKAHSSVLKPLFTRIKFLGLFVEDLSFDDDGASFILSGPVSIVSGAKAYGIKFASVLNILSEYESWNLSATLVHNDKDAILNLDQKSPISSSEKQKRKADFVPENIKTFIEMHNSKAPEWELEASCEMLNFGEESYCFPDLKAVSLGGEVKYIELFGKWNKSALTKRLSQLQSCVSQGVVVGVDKSLIKDKEIAKKIDKTPLFQKVGFSYRDLPSSKVLKSILAK